MKALKITLLKAEESYRFRQKNENGELVIIDERFSEEGNPYYKLTTVQNNNWCRINCYYADGTIDETYER